jgi:hypothetical protein
MLKVKTLFWYWNFGKTMSTGCMANVVRTPVWST